MSPDVTPRFKVERKPKKPRRSLRRIGKRTETHRERMDELRPVVFARAFWCCEIQAPGCTRNVEHAHHAVLRSQGGPDTLENLIATCSSCHTYVHANPEWARGRGFIRSRWSA